MADGNGDRHEARALVQGLVFGALVGGIVALWKTPRSGPALRAEIGRGGRKLVQNVEDAATSARRQVSGESVEESIAAAKAEARRLNRR